MFLIPATAQAEGISRQQADDILNELKQIRQLLQKQASQPARTNPTPARRPALKEAKVNLQNKIILGKKDAPVILIEVTDYQCPFCRKFHTEVFDTLKKEYIDTGKLLFINQDLPLGFHNNAMHAARAARCANDQGKYWDLRDAMIMNAKKLARDDITAYAKKLDLNTASLNKCIDSKDHQKEIDQDIADAGAAGISGTPTFIIAKNTPDKITGQVIVGIKPLEFFRTKIAELSSLDKKQAIGKNQQTKTKSSPASKNYRLNTESNELVLTGSGT